MPDHLHLLWMGTAANADQKLAMRFLRRHWNAVLAPHGVSLQPQAYDRVLRRDEMSGHSFEDMVLYIRKNPERAGLIKAWQDWEFGGAMVPGYPELPVYPAADFWHRFWTLYHKEVRRQEDLRKRIPSEEDGGSGRTTAH